MNTPDAHISTPAVEAAYAQLKESLPALTNILANAVKVNAKYHLVSKEPFVTVGLFRTLEDHYCIELMVSDKDGNFDQALIDANGLSTKPERVACVPISLAQELINRFHRDLSKAEVDTAARRKALEWDTLMFVSEDLINEHPELFSFWVDPPSTNIETEGHLSALLEYLRQTFRYIESVRALMPQTLIPVV